MKQILVYGSRDFGVIVRQLIMDCDLDFAGFIDDYYCGIDVVGSFETIKEHYSPEQYDVVIAIGYNNLEARWKVYQKVTASGYDTPILIHPRAYVSSTSRVQNGSIVMVGAIVDMNTIIQELVVIWPGVVVNHDSVIHENTFLSPNCTVCGFVTVGSHCFIGAGSVIADHRTVPPHTFLKAGRVFSFS